MTVVLFSMLDSWVVWGTSMESMLEITGQRRANGASRSVTLCERSVSSDRCDAAYRYTSTGTLLCVSTFCVSLPISSACRPRRPCDAIMIKSQPLLSQALRIAS